MYVIEFYKEAVRAWVKHAEYTDYKEAKVEFHALLSKEWYSYSKIRIVEVDEIDIRNLQRPLDLECYTVVELED